MAKFSLCCAGKIAEVFRRGRKILICDRCKQPLLMSDPKVLRGTWKNPYGG